MPDTPQPSDRHRAAAEEIAQALYPEGGGAFFPALYKTVVLPILARLFPDPIPIAVSRYTPACPDCGYPINPTPSPSDRAKAMRAEGQDSWGLVQEGSPPSDRELVNYLEQFFANRKRADWLTGNERSFLESLLARRRPERDDAFEAARRGPATVDSDAAYEEARKRGVERFMASIENASERDTDSILIAAIETCCPQCNSPLVSLDYEEETFEYGATDPVSITVEVPVWTCNNACNGTHGEPPFQWTDHAAELIKDGAVREMLQRIAREIAEAKLADPAAAMRDLVEAAEDLNTEIDDLLGLAYDLDSDHPIYAKASVLDQGAIERLRTALARAEAVEGKS